MLVCLLPTRNAASDLPGYLRCVSEAADAVVALDDGSEDETGDLLAASELVWRTLRNPRRDTYRGWDDHANRQRLLDAAGELDPDWVLFLDVDERIDRDDAATLRDFLGRDALPGCAYGLQLFRAWEGGRCLPRPTYVYRLFAYRPGLRLPAERLHFTPVPVSIAPATWVNTTIRIQHLDSPERLALRRLKYEQADPGGEWKRGAGPALEEPRGELVAWQPRPAGLPVLAAGPEIELATLPVPSRRPTLACLLPARNCEEDIRGYLDCVSRFADRVLALDDGSTDATAERLAAHPSVELVARNPRRLSYAGWDDAANRQRLLEAALAADVDWVLFLDSDERIDPGDAAALRSFVDLGADPECAYGFRSFRMLGDSGHYDRAGLWVYRLFAPRPDDELSAQRLHFVPVPISIPPWSWRRTTIRIQHLAGLTPELRQARFRKYEQADPDRRWQRDYTPLLAEPDRPKPWPARPPRFPVLADPANRGPGAEVDLETIGLDSPVLSAIVISQNDESTIEGSVRAVVEQDCSVPFEVILVTSGSDRTAGIVRERLPQVKVIELPEAALPGAARNAGLALARGEYVTFPGSHVRLLRGSFEGRVRAHERGYGMITGTVLNGTPTRSGWASYFLENSGSLPGRPSGELPTPPVRCSYVRELLLEVGGFPDDCRAGEDTAVNNELWSRGYKAYRSGEIRFVHHTPCTNPLRLVRHHYHRGRSLALILLGDIGPGAGMRARSRLRFVASYVPRRLAGIDTRVRRWGSEGERAYGDRGVRVLIALGVVASWVGCLLGLAAAARRAIRST